MIFRIGCLFVASLGYVTAANASICDSESAIDKVLKQAGKAVNADFMACKVLPHQPEFAVIAVANGDFSEHEGYGEYRLTLIQVNQHTAKIKTLYTDPKIIVSDAITFTGLSLDTAPYQMNPSTRAIGVRLEYTGSSRVNPYALETLSLYDLDRKQKLLSELDVNLDRGEWNGRCNGEWHESNSTLQMLNSKTNGYADIRVTTKTLDKETTDVLGDCKEVNPINNKFTDTLKFNGRVYQQVK